MKKSTKPYIDFKFIDSLMIYDFKEIRQIFST
jgi:hypothetical protein